ncbi:Polysaccharide deacetylase [Hathewaya proteolytica DSM 3090]|uniref:Polysaccharide deacetylase n=1 Tax=Hathewaya proteolytica DSM 3090 TaxID=1121331 RepID=A0A1M6Q605_9CLOT|nr:polysaccharide deacetylase family protein [Hathewaya proteolytica]SHK15615.1 Polysaccharide deacetylase [Hathewaya proteolytica DSM 3090]
MKKKYKILIAVLVLIILSLLINTIVKMKFTYNYFNRDVTKGQKEKLKEIKKLNEDISSINYNNCILEKKDVNEVRIPILMYHSISSINSMNNLMVPEEQFEQQIKWLKDNNFTPMLMDDVVKAFETGVVPKRPVAITFDDGYYDNYTDAYRILKKHKMRGTFFVVGSYVNESSMYMNEDNLKELRDNGMAIENHTFDHKRLYFKNKENQKKSIKDNMDFLKEKIQVESKYVCYPVGRYNKSTIEVGKELGTKAAVTTKQGIASLKNGILSLQRIRVKPMSLEKFKSYFEEFVE